MAQMTAAQIDDLPDSDFAYIEPGGTKDGGGRPSRAACGTSPSTTRRTSATPLRASRAAPSRARRRPRVEAAAKRMGIGEPAKGSMAGYHAARGADILEGLYQLIGDEADEPEQADVLRGAADALTRWIGMEMAEPDDAEDAAMAPMEGKATELKAEDMNASRLDRWLSGAIPRRVLVVPFGGPIPTKARARPRRRVLRRRHGPVRAVPGAARAAASGWWTGTTTTTRRA